MNKKIVLVTFYILVFAGISSCAVQTYNPRTGQVTSTTIDQYTFIGCSKRKGKDLYKCLSKKSGVSQITVAKMDYVCRSNGEWLSYQNEKLLCENREKVREFNCRKSNLQDQQHQCFRRLSKSKPVEFRSKILDCQKIGLGIDVKLNKDSTKYILDCSSVNTSKTNKTYIGNDSTYKNLGYGVSNVSQAYGFSGITPEKVVYSMNLDGWKEISERSPSVSLNSINFSVHQLKKGSTLAGAMGSLPIDSKQVRLNDNVVLSLKRSPSADSCFVLKDDANSPIAIRPNEEGINKYAFRHIVNEFASKVAVAEKDLQTAESTVSNLKENLRQLETGFYSQKAFKNGQCVKPAQRRIPPAPAKLDPKLVELNAHGHCFVMIGSRIEGGTNALSTALASSGSYDVVQDANLWMRSPSKRLSCANTAHSRWDSGSCKVWGIFGRLATEALQSCYSENVQACINRSKSNCNDEYYRWQRKRDRIVNEPIKQLQSCQNAKSSYENFNQASISSAINHRDNMKVKKDKALIKEVDLGPSKQLNFLDKRTLCI